MRGLLRILLVACTSMGVSADGGDPKAELLDVRMIWGRAPHNAFTDLVRFRDRWYCTFREGEAHVSPDGAVRVLTSADGQAWLPAARLEHPDADLRDPKLSVTPDNHLMLTAAAALHQPAEFRHLTLVWVSRDGREWTGPNRIGEPNMWLWRATWHLGRAYSAGYHTAGERFLRLYTSESGRRFEPLVETLFAEGSPSEASLLFLPDNSALCLLRRDGKTPSAQLGRARAPYRGWEWSDLGLRLGGPNLIRLPDGRIVAAGRLYDMERRTSLLWLDPGTGTLTEFLELPSGGDTSYPGLVFHAGLLWVSYYSSHEGRAMIYLARVKLPPQEDRSAPGPLRFTAPGAR